MALEQRAIVETGLAILQAEGFGALSLRKIADALGVQTPALYWHVENRAELYGLMAEHMFREAIEAVDPALSGREWLLAFGRSLHATHCRRRDAASLVSAVMPSPTLRRELLGVVVAQLARGGMDPEMASIAQSAIMSLTLGWSLFESNAEVRAVMGQTMDLAAGFDTSLEALVNGLFARQTERAVDSAARRQG